MPPCPMPLSTPQVSAPLWPRPPCPSPHCPPAQVVAPLFPSLPPALPLAQVTEDNFDNMFQLVLACNLVMLLPMPLLIFVPSSLELPAEEQAALEAEAAAAKLAEEGRDEAGIAALPPAVLGLTDLLQPLLKAGALGAEEWECNGNGGKAPLTRPSTGGTAAGRPASSNLAAVGWGEPPVPQQSFTQVSVGAWLADMSSPFANTAGKPGPGYPSSAGSEGEWGGLCAGLALGQEDGGQAADRTEAEESSSTTFLVRAGREN